MNIKNNNKLTNKRKFFRVNSNNPICSEVQIVNVNGKSVKSNPCSVCVKDIGIGGLRFLTRLILPLGENIVYKFKILILNKCYYIEGNIVRKEEYENGGFCYGVNFLMDDSDRSDYFTIFNNLALVIKRNVSQHGCNFCDITKCPNKQSS
mgnify:CR=1 FL=1